MAVPVAKMFIGAVASMGAAYGTWRILEEGLGAGLIAQTIEVGAALVVAGCIYASVVVGLRVDEAGALMRMLRTRLSR
jgi:hypothetical protein